MDFLAHIQAIENRIQEIEERFEGPPDIQSPQLSFQQVLSNYTQPIAQEPEPPHAGIGKGVSGFHDLVHEAGAQYGVDPSLIAAVMHQESGGNPNARSPVGAAGLMQLMPETAKSLGVTDAYDPRQNIFGGARYLRGLMDQFGGNISFALAAYNAGSNAVRRYGGIPPYRETQNYVKNILSNYHSMRAQSGRT